jgi:nickel/cobalt exporter
MPGLDNPILWPLLATAFAAAFLHAVLPTHWLPFVLVGRGQGWSAGRTLGAAALSGAAHVIVTIVIGLLIVLLGVELDRRFDGLLPVISSLILAALGLYFLLTRKKGGRKVHAQTAPDAPVRHFASDRAALASLVAVLAFYPSEAFLPVYLTAAPLGWGAFALLSLILAGATIMGMMLFTSLALAGASRLRFERWERYERFILSFVLFALAAMVLFWRP